MRQPVRELCEMAMMLEDDEESARILEDSKVVFATPQYRSEALMADAMLKYKQLGYPLQWIAEQMGQSPRTSSASCAWWTTRITIRRWLR